jgi:hypothetical protein
LTLPDQYDIFAQLIEELDELDVSELPEELDVLELDGSEVLDVSELPEELDGSEELDVSELLELELLPLLPSVVLAVSSLQWTSETETPVASNTELQG